MPKQSVRLSSGGGIEGTTTRKRRFLGPAHRAMPETPDNGGYKQEAQDDRVAHELPTRTPSPIPTYDSDEEATEEAIRTNHDTCKGGSCVRRE